MQEILKAIKGVTREDKKRRRIQKQMTNIAIHSKLYTKSNAEDDARLNGEAT